MSLIFCLGKEDVASLLLNITSEFFQVVRQVFENVLPDLFC